MTPRRGNGCCVACGFLACGWAKPWPSIGMMGRLFSTPRGSIPRSISRRKGRSPAGRKWCPSRPTLPSGYLPRRPQGERVGKVFPLVDWTTGKPLAAHNTVGPVVSAIGRKAGVVVGQTEKLVEEGGKRSRSPSSCLRGPMTYGGRFVPDGQGRSCRPSCNGLARHAHISTTMGYYVCLTADEMAGDLWANHGATLEKPQEGNISGNIDLEEGKTQGQEIGGKLLQGKR